MGLAALSDEATSASAGIGSMSDPTAEAFRAAFEATYPDLVAYARRRTDNWSDADDVVSEVYTIAWRRWADRDPEAATLPWLYGIAANVVRNSWRSTGRRLRLVDRLATQPDRSGSGNGDAGDPAERDAVGLREALGHLSFDDQEVLRLVAWEGLSHAEVGAVLGCSTNAVGVRVHRARQRLQRQLDDAGPTTNDPTEETP